MPADEQEGLVIIARIHKRAIGIEVTSRGFYSANETRQGRTIERATLT